MKHLSQILKLAVLLMITAGCDAPNSNTPAVQATACQAGAAQIAVADGYLQNVCGCNEPAGTLSGPSMSLTCTVRPNTIVLFRYQATRLKHQIIPTGTTDLSIFGASPVSDPLSSAPVLVHAIQLTASGTYTFQDAFNSALSGQIVVP